MHTPAPRTIGLRTTEVTYPGGTEHIRTVQADLRAVLDDCSRADDVILCASASQKRSSGPTLERRRPLPTRRA